MGLRWPMVYVPIVSIVVIISFSNREVDDSVPNSDEGWLYGVDFRTLDHIKRTEIKSEFMRVRRKRWIRKIKYAPNISQRQDIEESDDKKLKNDNLTITDDVFEMHSDDEEDDDDDKTMLAAAFTSRSNEFHSRPVRDPQLVAIGKKMKVIEMECKKDDEQQAKEWQQNMKPIFQQQISELTLKVEEYDKRMETEINLGT